MSLISEPNFPEQQDSAAEGESMIFRVRLPGFTPWLGSC